MLARRDASKHGMSQESRKKQSETEMCGHASVCHECDAHTNTTPPLPAVMRESVITAAEHTLAAECCHIQQASAPETP